MIKIDNSGTLVTGAHIELYRLSVLKSALKLAKHGIKTPGRSPLKVCREDYGLKGKSAEILLPQVEELIKKFVAEHPDPDSKSGK